MLKTWLDHCMYVTFEYVELRLHIIIMWTGIIILPTKCAETHHVL